MRIDPNGRFWFLIPIGIGIVAGGYVGGAWANDWNFNPTQWDWNSGRTWAGIGVGGIFGGFAGSCIAGWAGLGAATSAITAESIVWGGLTSAFQGGAMSMVSHAVMSGGDVTPESMFGNGAVGFLSGGFAGTGGAGIMYGAKALGGGGWSIAGGLLSQAIGTAGASIGYNIANGKDPLSSWYLGLGPINIPFKNGFNISSDAGDWLGSNIGNALFYGVGLANLGVSKVAWAIDQIPGVNAPSWLIDGSIGFDVDSLSFKFGGGLLGAAYDLANYLNTGAYSIVYGSGQYFPHERHHIWQSRMLGSWEFLLQYFLGHGLIGGYDYNWFELQAGQHGMSGHW